MILKGIVIAAGLGSRMGSLTTDRPKCLLPIAGRSLLEHTVSNLRAVGCDEIVVIAGYKVEKIPQGGFITVINPEFEQNNILHSLLYAREHLEGRILATYADIWVEPFIHRRLVESTQDIDVAVDRNWQGYYENRPHVAICDADNALLHADGRVIDIGKQVDPEKTAGNLCGEFLGVWSMSERGTREFVQLFDEIDARQSREAPFQNAAQWRRAYVCDLFQELLDRGARIGSTVVDRSWAEFDTAADYHRLGAIAERQRLVTLLQRSRPGLKSSASPPRFQPNW